MSSSLINLKPTHTSYPWVEVVDFTQKSLENQGINLVYANEGNCNNYLLTSWTVQTGKELITSKGTSYTNTYGSLYGNPYNSTVSYNGTSSTYTSPSVTYENATYTGTYTLEIGKIKNNNLLKVWGGIQSGKIYGSNLAENQAVTDKSQPIIDEMIQKMLVENHFINIQ